MQKVRSWLGYVPLFLAFSVIMLISFRAVHAATGALTGAPDDASILDLLRPVYDAFHGGHYAYGAALGVIALVALVKSYLGDRIKWLHTDAGGSLLALLMSSATAVATGLAAPDAHVTFALLKSALLVGIGAAGGYAMIKNLIVEPLLPHLPAWLRSVLTPILWIFDSSGKPSDVKIAEAVAAGNAAVEAKPPTGIAGVVGAPTDVS